MIVCIYDGSENGLFTAVFELYKNNINPDIITSEKQIQWAFDTQLLNYGTDYEKADRIKNSIIKSIGNDGYRSVLYVAASCNENKGKAIYDFLKIMFIYKKDAPFMLSNKYVQNYLDISRAVAFEIHRMQGFIHFKECENGVYYAEFSPDSDITKFIMPHFAYRFNSMQFILHDVKRNIIGIYNGEKYTVFQNSRDITVYLSESEEKFLKLYKSYYKAINIEGRRNKKLQNGFLPVRYRKHMPETFEN